MRESGNLSPPEKMRPLRGSVPLPPLTFSTRDAIIKTKTPSSPPGKPGKRDGGRSDMNPQDVKITVALLQLRPCATQEENLKKGLEACKRAKASGADIALFPEMWSNGYALTWDREQNRRAAVPADGEFTGAFSALAKELDMAIAVTFLERFSPLPRNSVRLFDRTGRPVLHYAKVHTCDFDVERNLTRGEAFPTTELNTAKGPVKVGAMICYDREFPESARILMLKGAELILVPNACPMEINRLSQLRARAYENMTAIATVNYAAGTPDCNGHSSAFDGIAYRGDCPRDTLVAEAGEEEGIYPAVIPLGELRRYRESECQGNAYRRPELYGELISEKILPPFVRGDRR